jgi:hypothetical protein
LAAATLNVRGKGFGEAVIPLESYMSTQNDDSTGIQNTQEPNTNTYSGY